MLKPMCLNVITDAPVSNNGDYVRVPGGIGEDVTLPYDVSANPAPTYKWSKGGTDIPGVESSTLIIR